MNRLRAACWCALFWCLSMGGRAEGLSAAWDPAHTWVFTVGILEWKRSDAWVPFPKTNRRDVRWTLAWQKLGVPPAHITYLSDHGATHRAIFDAFADTMKQVPPGDTLVFYYTGHGYREPDGSSFYMVPYDGFEADTLWSMAQLEQGLARGFHGSRLLMAADCCYSGSLNTLVSRWKGSASLFVLTSSTDNRPSTGNWTFSDSLLDSLDGDPRVDANRDGTLTLAEAARQAELDMAFAERQQAGGSASPGHSLAELAWTRSGRSLRPSEGTYVQVHYKDGITYKARVLDRGPQGVLVRWMGLSRDYPDEWVPLSDVQASSDVSSFYGLDSVNP